MTYFFQDGGKHDFEENLTLDGSRFQVFGSGFFCFQPMDVHLASRQVDHTMQDAFCVFLAPPSPPRGSHKITGGTEGLPPTWLASAAETT